MQGGVTRYCATVVTRNRLLANLGQGRPIVPHSQSHTIKPSTCLLFSMISALRRVCIPDHTLRRGSLDGLLHTLHMKNSCAWVGRSKMAVLLPSSVLSHDELS